MTEPDAPTHLLFVCGRNKRRSPTAERLFRRVPGLHVRSAGFSPKSPRTLSEADVRWADAIFVMEREHKRRLREAFRRQLDATTVHVLDIPDDYERDAPELIELLRERLRALLPGHEP